MGRLLSYGDGNSGNDGRMKKNNGSGYSTATNGNANLDEDSYLVVFADELDHWRLLLKNNNSNTRRSSSLQETAIVKCKCQKCAVMWMLRMN